MSKETKLRTVKKWQEEINVGLEYDLRGDFVTAIQCKFCKKWKSRIKSMNGNNDTWVREGLKCVEKSRLKKHLESASHKKAADCEKRKNLGIEKYNEKVIDETPIGRFEANGY